MSYSDEVLRRFDRPRHAGVLDGGCRGEAGSRAGGTQVEWWLRVTDGRIERARFLAHGCPHVIAGADWLAERIEGLSPEAAREVGAGAVAAALEAPAEKLGALLAVEDALAAALRRASGN